MVGRSFYGAPAALPRGFGPIIEGGDIDDTGNGPGPRRTQRSTSGVPSANERRLVPDEVVVEIANSVSPQQIDALQRSHRLTRIESQTFQLSGTTLFRWRIPDRRSVATVVRALEADRTVASAQPNYLFTLQQDETKAAPEGDAAQYELAKLHLPQAHTLAKGDKVLVAVIDSGVDATHPEFDGRDRANLRHALAADDAAQARHRYRRPDRGAWQADGRGAGAHISWRSAPSTAPARAPKAPPSTFSKASTGRRRMARASSI